MTRKICWTSDPVMGDIGEGQKEYEFEPLTTPLAVPVPAEAPDREVVPA